MRGKFSLVSFFLSSLILISPRLPFCPEPLILCHFSPFHTFHTHKERKRGENQKRKRESKEKEESSFEEEPEKKIIKNGGKENVTKKGRARNQRSHE